MRTNEHWSSTIFADAPDGRRLACQVKGPPEGLPTFLISGTPSSRLGPVPRALLLMKLGMRVITYDRPGYGESTPLVGLRDIARASEDVEILADHLELKRFNVVGRSGGGSIALSCVNRMPERVGAAVMLATTTPPDLDFAKGMVNSNQAVYKQDAWEVAPGLWLKEDHETETNRDIRQRAEETKENPGYVLESIKGGFEEDDLRILGTTALRSQLLETYREAVRNGPEGWVTDVFALRRPWGFDPTDINTEDRPYVPLLFWHGENDKFSPPEPARVLASKINGAKFVRGQGASHFSAFGVTVDMLSWAAKASKEGK